MASNEYDELVGRMDYLERNKITKMEDNIKLIKLNQVEMAGLTKQFTTTIDNQGKMLQKQSDTMETMTMALHDIVNNIKDSNRVSSELAQKIEESNRKIDTFEENVNCKFKEVDHRIDEQDNKTKVDFAIVIRNWLVGGGAVAIIGYVAMNVFGK